MRKIKQCKTCGKIIKKNKIYCEKCKIFGNCKGKNSPRYIDGRTNEKIFCSFKKCETEISYYIYVNGTGMCEKHKIETNNNQRRSKIKNYCCILNCNQQISEKAKRCRKHADIQHSIDIKKPEVIVNCKICGKELNKHAYYYGTELCKKHSADKHSERMSGRNNPRFGLIAVNAKRIKYKNINFRSTWESKYAKYLDSNNIRWQYESKTFDLGECTYTPDFYLPKTNEYIEIKGWWRDRALEKLTLFLMNYPSINVKIIEKQDLKKLGIKI